MQNFHAGWNFDNSYSRLPGIFHRSQLPTPVREPKLIMFNDSLAATLGLDANVLKSEDGAAVLAGNQIPDGAEPLAQAYAGHQFGHFTMLGDGRAVLLGEQLTPQGERVDIQYKGSGRTPYSRGGDGRAGLGPMLREYIISEAMHGLGIPTTRSLAVVETGRGNHSRNDASWCGVDSSGRQSFASWDVPVCCKLVQGRGSSAWPTMRSNVIILRLKADEN